MPEETRDIEIDRLHEKVLYVVADGERKDAVSVIFYLVWIISGLVIIFLALNHGRDAVLMALQVAAMASGILWLINSCWKHRLHARYLPGIKVQRQFTSEKSR